MVACCPSTRYRSPNITTESHTVHDTAREHGRLFFQLYGSDTLRTVVELGSQDVNGTLREHCPLNVHYIGLDIMPAKGVDLVINPDLPLPLVSESVDAVVTSSAFEHDVCFWATFLELVRILRPGGLLYVNVPSNGAFHRYPLDCWRFYPDAGVALTRWAVRNGMALDLLESFIGIPQSEKWGDFVAVFRKAGGAPLVRQGCIADHTPAFNIHDQNAPPEAPLRAESVSMPDMLIGEAIQAERDAARRDNAALRDEVAALRSEAATLHTDAATLRATLAATEQQLAATEQQLAATIEAARKQVADLTADAEARIAAFAADLAGARRDLDAMQSSSSWRLTAPVRRLVTAVRGR